MQQFWNGDNSKALDANEERIARIEQLTVCCHGLAFSFLESSRRHEINLSEFFPPDNSYDSSVSLVEFSLRYPDTSCVVPEIRRMVLRAAAEREDVKPGSGDPSNMLQLQPLFATRLRFCVHYCIDRDAVKKKTGFLTLSKKKNCAKRGFLIGLSTKQSREIWKQDNQTNVLDLTMRTLTTHTHTHTQTDT